MFLRILLDFFLRRKGRIAIAVLAVVMGAAITSSLITVSWDITDKVGRELKAFGANIAVTPNSTSIPIEVGGISFATLEEQQYINGSDLPKLKTIFWRHQIVAFAPYLYGLVQVGSEQVILTGTWFNKTITIPGSSVALPNGTILQRSGGVFTTGVRTIAPWWEVEGNWASDENESWSIVGSSVAKKLNLAVGDTFSITYQNDSYNLIIAGIVTTGSFEDDQIFVTLDAAQTILGKSDKVQKVLVSALIKPDDELAKKDHKEMTELEHVTWYCSPYIGVFTYQIEEVLPGVKAKPIRQVAETEGRLLEQNQLLFTLIALSSIGSSAVAVASTMVASVLQRRREIGLMKAIGADNLQIATQFLAEAGIIGILGGLLGFPLGYLLSGFVASSVFASPATSLNPTILSITLIVAIGISLAGSIFPVKKAIGIEAAAVLRGE